MRITNRAFDFVIEADENTSISIVCENPKVFYEIDYNIECDVKDLIKIYNLKLNYESSSLLEKLSIYIKLVAMAFNLQILFLVDIRRYLTEYEVLALYKEARYWKIQLVIIESRFVDKLENEKVIIIDRDRCIIEI